MIILYGAIILLLLVGAFAAGKVIADRYHERIEAEYEYMIKVIAAERGVGYIAPPERKPQNHIGQPFMDRLRETGRATQAIR